MTSLFIRYLFICFCELYAYYTVSNTHKHNIITNIYITLSIFFTALISSFIPTNDALIRIFIVYNLTCFCLLLQNKASFSFTLLLFSLGISFTLYIISGTITSFISILIYKSFESVPHDVLPIYTGITQVFLSILLFKNKRLRNGLLFLSCRNNIKHGAIIICIIFYNLAFISHIEGNASPSTRTICISTILFFAFSFLFYWRYRITQTYKEKLHLANQKSLENELNSKTEEISRLKADNERLASIVHKDNKLIPAMEQTVMDYLKNSHNLSPFEQKEIGHSLGAHLHSMALERHGVLSSSSKTSTSWSKSGIHTVDGMLSFMETRCENENITYKVQIEENITELIRSAISEEDLLHLLGDLIDNAIIAIRYTNNAGTVGVYLGSLQKHFLLEIADNGVPFTPETYQYFGNTQYTTHSKGGGTGIGLMDIYSIKKKYQASLQIYEYPSNTHTYTKKITFIFDKKKHFLVQTYRYRELSSIQTRHDIYVLPNNTK